MKGGGSGLTSLSLDGVNVQIHASYVPYIVGDADGKSSLVQNILPGEKMTTTPFHVHEP